MAERDQDEQLAHHEEQLAQTEETRARALLAVAALFLKLGLISFGGPAAHIAMMRQEVVQRRRWIGDARFLDLVGLVNVIPGPSSTELGIYLGYLRAGWPGLIMAGVSFIAPAMAIVLALAWAYVTYGSTPQAAGFLYGVKPVVIAIIAQALWGLGRVALRGALPLAIAVPALLLYIVSGNALAVLVCGGLVASLAHWIGRMRREGPLRPALFLPGAGAAMAAAAAPFSYVTLFLTFLKIGAVLYGSGYVLLAFLRADFVSHLHWLTDRQLLDAVSVGQFTPGPVFTTATFIGYLVGRWYGAIIATIAIFLPAFIFVPLIHRLAAILRRSQWASAILDGVNAAALALMAGATIQLGQSAIIDGLTGAIALVSFAVLGRLRVNSAWLILSGGMLGLVVRHTMGGL